MPTYEVFIRASDPMHGRKAHYRPHRGTDRFQHTELSEKEFRDLIFESQKNARVIISGGPARKLRRTDIKLVEWKDGKPLSKYP